MTRWSSSSHYPTQAGDEALPGMVWLIGPYVRWPLFRAACKVAIFQHVCGNSEPVSAT
jgi:hypothetical protein